MSVTSQNYAHNYVDLGVSVKWATCNVGAEKPEDYGGYYAWGETGMKDYYDWSTYKYCKGSYNKLTKYCGGGSFGYNGYSDKITVLESSDDVAHVKWGGDWRMPTKAEWEELLDRKNFTWKWIEQNGVKGYKVISKKAGYDGNSIFLPATGIYENGDITTSGVYGNYWSSTLVSYCSYAKALWIGDEWIYLSNGDRCYGFSVRPVRP